MSKQLYVPVSKKSGSAKNSPPPPADVDAPPALENDESLPDLPPPLTRSPPNDLLIVPLSREDVASVSALSVAVPEDTESSGVIIPTDEPTDDEESDSNKNDAEAEAEGDTDMKTDDHHSDGGFSCPQCHNKKKRKTGGFPFGRKPADPNAPKKVKEEPKTQWGKFQRTFIEKYPGESAEVACAVARVHYVPVHSDVAEPKSLERLIRETYGFINPQWKKLKGEPKNEQLRAWVEGQLTSAILTHAHQKTEVSTNIKISPQ